MQATLKSLRYFLCAVEHRSITRAATQMHVVPSAILAAINQVESTFNLKLVTRYRAKGIQPTTTGQILVEKIRHLLDEYETLLNEGADLRSRLTGTLRIGYYAPIAPAFMPAIVEPLINNNEGVDIKLYDCDNQRAQQGLINGHYDAILCVADNLKTGVNYETLIDVSPYLLASKNHPLARYSAVSVKDLASEQLVLLDLPVVSECYSAIFERANIAPPIVATTTSVEMVRSLVGSGVGCSILHMRPFTDRSYSGDDLVAIPFKSKLNPLRIVVGYHKDNPRRLLRAFIGALREYFQSHQARELLVATAAKAGQYRA